MTGENIKQSSPTAVPETVFAIMGKILGQTINSEADNLRLVMRGISTKDFLVVAHRLKLPRGVVVSESTLRRRIRAHHLHVQGEQERDPASNTIEATATSTSQEDKARLTSKETERLLRITRVVSQATQVFGSESQALSWINTPADFLNDDKPVTPMKLAETEAGARMMESMIKRTAYGSF